MVSQILNIFSLIFYYRNSDVLKIELTVYADGLNKGCEEGEESGMTVIFWPEHLEGSVKAGVGKENQEFSYRHDVY